MIVCGHCGKEFEQEDACETADCPYCYGLNILEVGS